MSEKKTTSSVRSDLLKKLLPTESGESDRARGAIHQDVLAMSGIVPAEIDAEAKYHDHLYRKHQ